MWKRSSSKTDDAVAPATPERDSKQMVQFVDSPASSKGSLNLGEATVHDMMARIEKLNSQLSEAKVNLSGEKALRKKKEKNLVKLAKELKKRASDTDAKSEEIAKLEKEVSELRASLRTAEADTKAQQRELNEAQQQFRKVCRDYDTHLAEARTQNDSKSAELRDAVLKANQETNSLRAKVAAMEKQHERELAEAMQKQEITNMVTRTNTAAVAATKAASSTTSPMDPERKAKTTMILLIACVVAAIGAAVTPSMDAVCSPARPGTVLFESSGPNATTTIMEAPWWAPDPYKATAFRLFCGSRARSRLDWSKGKLAYFRSIEQEKDTWQRRAFSVQVEEDRIVLLNKKGKVFADIPTTM